VTGLKIFVAAALLSAISATSAHAQAAFSEPEAFQAEYPNRDVLNGGALTPAGRMGLELPDGATNVHAANNAYASMRGDAPSFRAKRYHSYDPTTDDLLGYDGRRHPLR
jgi:BA14K-like protein